MQPLVGSYLGFDATCVAGGLATVAVAVEIAVFNEAVVVLVVELDADELVVVGGGGVFLALTTA